MTIQEIYNRLSEIHPNQYSTPLLISWVNDLEKDISVYLSLFHEPSAEPQEKLDKLSDEVTLDEPDIYVEYLISRICLANEEYDRYNTHAALFEARYSEWKDRYIREHQPINKGRFKV